MTNFMQLLEVIEDVSCSENPVHPRAKCNSTADERESTKQKQSPKELQNVFAKLNYNTTQKREKKERERWQSHSRKSRPTEAQIKSTTSKTRDLTKTKAQIA